MPSHSSPRPCRRGCEPWPPPTPTAISLPRLSIWRPRATSNASTIPTVRSASASVRAQRSARCEPRRSQRPHLRSGGSRPDGDPPSLYFGTAHRPQNQDGPDRAGSPRPQGQGVACFDHCFCSSSGGLGDR